MRSAMASSQFWLLAFSFGICGFTTSGLLQTHLISHGIEHGFPEMTMGVSLGLMGATDMIGTFYPDGCAIALANAGPLQFITRLGAFR